MKRTIIITALLLTCARIHAQRPVAARDTVAAEAATRTIVEADTVEAAAAIEPIESADAARMAAIDGKLSALAERDPSFAREVDITSGRLPLGELLRNMARASGVNLSVRSVEQTPVSCNFARTRVDDMLRFLCNEYRLDIEVSGNIVSVFPAAAPELPAPDPDITFERRDSTLSFDLRGERLIDVAKKIASLTSRNIIIPEPLYDRSVSGFVRGMPLAAAIYTLGEVNGLAAERDARDVWSIRDEANDGNAPPAPRRDRRRFAENELRADSTGRITAHIAGGDVQDIILDLCEQMGLNHYFRTPVNLTAGIWVDDVDFETLLAVLLKGSAYTFCTERGIWIFGTAASDDLVSTEMVELTCRSVSKIEELIPSSLKEGVEIKTFPDLNALILGGDRRDVSRTAAFLRSIDKPVPLVTMEIIIAEVQRSDIRETGIGGGIGSSPVATEGTFTEGVDMTLGANTVNNLLRRIRGTVNLGRVGQNFYMSLHALEERGTIRLQSTPKLSTLNGHEAVLTSGETQYYKEVQNNYYGTQNPIQSESYTWKSVDADLTIKVTPYVSRDGHITLEIEFEQTEFTDRTEKNAPPATATRSFKSIVKVCNEEMVLLGGLDRNTLEKSSRGIPFLARIPVIKWFFGKEKRNKVERSLSVFIKPTVTE